MYIPNNAQVFTAAFAGCLAGMAASGRNPTSITPADYDNTVATVGAFAQEFDTLWALTPAATLELQTIEEACEGAWSGRAPLDDPSGIVPATWQPLCQGIITIVQAGLAYYTAQSIPNPPAGGGAPFAGSLSTFNIFVGGDNTQYGISGAGLSYTSKSGRAWFMCTVEFVDSNGNAPAPGLSLFTAQLFQDGIPFSANGFGEASFAAEWPHIASTPTLTFTFQMVETLDLTAHVYTLVGSVLSPSGLQLDGAQVIQTVLTILDIAL